MKTKLGRFSFYDPRDFIGIPIGYFLVTNVVIVHSIFNAWTFRYVVVPGSFLIYLRAVKNARTILTAGTSLSFKLARIASSGGDL